MQSRLKRAIELGIEPAPVVPTDRNVPHQLHEQRTKSCAKGTMAKKSKNQDVSRQIDNLDYRLRQLEGDRVTYFLSAERCPRVVAKLKAAEDHYKSRAPQRGQPHPDHNKKATLMAALLNWTAMQDNASLYEGAKEEVDRHNKVLAAQRKPSLPEQLTALKKSCFITRSRYREVGKPAPSSQPNAIPATLSCHSVYCHSLLSTTSRHSCASHWKQQEEYKRPVQMKLDRYARRAAPERHTRSMHDYFSPRASSDTGRCVRVRAAVPPRHVREADEGGESSEPATLVRGTAVGESPQKTRGPRVCPPAKAESVRLQRALSAPFEPRLVHTDI